jgi:probable F420-dependent oxidoreductase
MTATLRDRVGRFGVWRQGPQVTTDLASELERLGFGTLWLGRSPAGDLVQAEQLLDATSTLTVGTSIVNMWQDDAHTVASSFHRLAGRHPGRFVLGVGAGHPEASQSYQRPYETLAGYVDTLLQDAVPRDDIVLAALGPRVLRLAAERAGGAIPYLVPPEHTRRAREILGPGPLLAPEQKVVVDTDAGRARTLGRSRVRPYLDMYNYTSNLRRLGWGDADLDGGGSDALTDTLAVHGSADEVAGRLGEHRAAGADHVAVQLLTEPRADPLPGYRDLARALSLRSA